MSRLAWSTAGFVCSDGPELVAWDRNIDAPSWRRTLSSPIVALASDARLIAALEQSGQLSFWNGADGVPAGGSTNPGWRALAMGGGGCALASEDRVDLLDRSGARSLSVPGATCVRYARDGHRLAVGQLDGTVSFFDAASGAAAGSVKVPGGGVTDLVERAPGGDWLATAGDTLQMINPSGVRRVTGMTGKTLAAVSANERGTLVAIQAGDSFVVVLAWPTLKTACSLRYPERTVAGVAVGAGALWVGLDQGDGNKLDLRSGELCRTDPHPGRELNRWLVAKSHDAEVALPAL